MYVQHPLAKPVGLQKRYTTVNIFINIFQILFKGGGVSWFLIFLLYVQLALEMVEKCLKSPKKLILIFLQVKNKKWVGKKQKMGW